MKMIKKRHPLPHSAKLVWTLNSFYRRWFSDKCVAP